MKKTLKKFISTALILGMLLGIASVPAMADAAYFKTPKFKIGFDSLTPDSGIGGNPSKWVNGGYEDGSYSGFYMLNELSENRAMYVNDGNTLNKGAKSTIIERAKGNNALEILVNSASEKATPYVNFGYEPSIEIPTDKNYILHFGFDIMRKDLSCLWRLWLDKGTSNSSDYIYDVLNFGTDGKIKFFGNEVNTYEINNWYKIDVYLDFSTDKNYLYINDEQAGVEAKNLGVTTLAKIHSRWEVPAGSVTAVCFDNFIVDEYVNKESEYVKAGFDSLKGGTIGGNAGNGGTENSMWDGFTFVNEATNESKGLSVADGATYNNGAKWEIISRGTDDNAMEATVNSSANVQPYISMGDNLATKFQKENSVMHFGIDLYRYDKSCEWYVVLKDKTYGYQLYNLVQFTADGKLKFLGNEVCNYDTNTWYNMDIYYRVNSNRWYLYLNGELAKTATNKINLETLDFIRAYWTSPTGQETKLAVDNICIGEISLDTKLGDISLTQNGTKISDNKFAAGTINAECDVVLSDASKKPSLVIARYVDGELTELSVGSYEEAKAIAAYDVKEASGTVKIMLLDSMGSIYPLKKNIELSAK